MIIIGNEFINYPKFVKISHITDIKQTKPLDIVVFDYDIKIVSYCNKNNITFAVITDNITDIIFSNALNAKFIIVKENSQEIQKIAENYMFDTKILQLISNDMQIESIARWGIDGVIYEDSIKGL